MERFYQRRNARIFGVGAPAPTRRGLQPSAHRSFRARRGTGENQLRVVLPRGIAGDRRTCEIKIDQSRAIDSRRLVRALRALRHTVTDEVAEKLRRLGEL